MSFAEIKDALPALSAAERADLLDHLYALEEGMSVDEYRHMKAAIREALDDSSSEFTVEEIETDLESLKPGDVP